ncbi:MAG: right-handed parallel beta-helix repeat-containing protein [Cyclobacteriaceae bacterium]
MQKFLDKAVKKSKGEVVIPPGRYRVAPQGQTHLTLEGLQDITIIADGVEMICTETVQAINIRNCKNLKIQGLVIDYDPLPFTQGRIVSMSEDKAQLTVDLLEGYETNLRNDKLEIYDPQTGELVTRTYYGVTHELDRKNRQVVFSKKRAAGLEHSFEEIGDIVVFDSYNTKFVPHTIIMNNNENLVLENVKIYSGTTFAFFERECNGTKYLGCHVDRRQPESDLREREIRRMRSNNADGFHSKSAEIGPSYRNCIARYNGDDGFAISGLYHVITETNGNMVTVVGKAGRRPDIGVADPVELVSYDGTRIPDAYVRSIVPGRKLNAEEREFLSSQKFLAESQKTKDADNVYIIELNRAVDLPLGSVIASSERLGNGFEVVDCIAGPNRSRGIIAKASNGMISNNQLIDNWGIAIKCSPEHQWLEAGSGNNLLITNNVVQGCHDVGIAVYAKGGNGKIGAAGAHNNVNVSGNTVSNSVNPGFGITSTVGLIFMDNRVETPDNSLALPWRKDFGRGESTERKVYFQNVTDVKENFGVEKE